MLEYTWKNPDHMRFYHLIYRQGVIVHLGKLLKIKGPQVQGLLVMTCYGGKHLWNESLESKVGSRKIEAYVTKQCRCEKCACRSSYLQRNLSLWQTLQLWKTFESWRTKMSQYFGTGVLVWCWFMGVSGVCGGLVTLVLVGVCMREKGRNQYILVNILRYSFFSFFSFFNLNCFMRFNQILQRVCYGLKWK